MAKSNRRLLSMRYPYTIAYCTFFGSFQYWIDEQLSHAEKYNCPGNTINISMDGKFETISDITNPEMRKIFGLDWL